jgi:hypothetical protein
MQPAPKTDSAGVPSFAQMFLSSFPTKVLVVTREAVVVGCLPSSLPIATILIIINGKKARLI